MIIFKTSNGLIGIKIFNGIFGKIPHHVAFACSFGPLKGKFFHVGKLFGLHSSLFKEEIDHCLTENDTWESNESM